jgi:hypothetical protein
MQQPYNFYYDTTLQIIKYQKISSYCQINNQIDLTYSSCQKIDDKKNLIYFKKVDSFSNFRLYILFYFDWFPHIQLFNLTGYDNDFAKVMWYILKENIKSNARKWNIFLEQTKIEMKFNEFLNYLVLNNEKFKSYFNTKEFFQNTKCYNCCFREIININDLISFCRNKSLMYKDKNKCYHFKKR